MRNRITLKTFRKLDHAEEMMMRAVMPKASAASPDRLETRGWCKTTQRSARTLTMACAFTVKEVAHA